MLKIFSGVLFILSTRVVNKYREDFDIDIMRPTMWGNPFSIGKDGDRLEVITKHKSHLRQQIREGYFGIEHLLFLKGKRLGCCCKPKKCHGDNYVELLEEFTKGVVTSRLCKIMGHTAYDYCSSKVQSKLDTIQSKKRKVISKAKLDHNLALMPMYQHLEKAKYKNRKLVSTSFDDLPETLTDTPISKIFNPYPFITLYGVIVDSADSVFMLSDIKVARKGESKLRYPDFLNMRVVSSAMFARGVITTPPHLLSIASTVDRHNAKLASYIARAAAIMGIPINGVALVDISSRKRLASVVVC